MSESQKTGWGKVKAGAQHAGLSERTFRPLLKKGLRHVRLPSGTILIKFSWIDEYLGKFEVVENDVDQVVEDVLKDINLI